MDVTEILSFVRDGSAAGPVCDHTTLDAWHADRRMADLNFTSLEAKAFTGLNLPSFPTWQLLVVGGVVSWLIFTQLTDFTKHLRALVQPFVLRHVEKGVHVVLQIQKYEHPLLDAVLSTVAVVVSVEFYTVALPLLFWSGHARLARQLTLLMAVCIYVGNSFKDLVCAPRPPSPPVRRIVPSNCEQKGSQEYGLPSSHTINTICLTGYVLYHIVRQQGELGSQSVGNIAALLTTIVFLVVYGRLYLGMHSPIDILAGGAIGALLLVGWCMIDDYVDAFIIGGENVISFWATAAVLALYAYPTPESPTPSFEFHTAFNGVAFGIVSGLHRTYPLFHSGIAPAMPLTYAGIIAVSKRLAVGIPTILIVKELSKALAIILIPLLCNLLGFRARSSSYVRALRKDMVKDGEKAPVEARRFAGVLSVFSGDNESIDVDTGIRLVQYAGLGWAVVELAPYLFVRMAWLGLGC